MAAALPLLRRNLVASIATENSGRGEAPGVWEITQMFHLLSANVAFAGR
jgi:hypothetical protein